MIKLNKDNLVEFNNTTTELRGVLLGYKKDEHDKPVFIHFNNRDSNIENKIIIGKPEPGKGFYLK
ncbi:MAG: hypothetical protein HPY74_20900 [Firmicutes bacterium]|nr:hypothetical protein [Melioribacter sp.]NSW93065.1 hypothetical protein [Bacillota bacterium]